MKIWQKALIPTCITLLIGGGYLFSVYKHRQEPGAINQKAAGAPVKPDDLAVVREMFQQHYEDALNLVGTSVWMKDGYVLPYYPYTRGGIVFHRAGLIPAAQRLDIKKIVKASVPASEDDRMEHGTRQVFAVFTLPGDSKLYATPIGAIEGSQEAYYCDLLFYYDDPHTIYDNWPKDAWAAIDAHQVKPGMSELQARMSLGQNLEVSGHTEGDRTVTYNVNGKHWTVTFIHNKATTITSE